MNVVITISAYNEEKNLPSVVREARRFGAVVVIDDGSSDNTAIVGENSGAEVVRLPINLGQGMANLTGFRVALAMDCDVVIQMDGDGQHNPDEIPKFLLELQEGEADIVVGSRILGSNYQSAPFFRRLFLPYLTWIINRLTGYELTDSMCGYRAFRAESLRRIQYIFDRFREPQYMTAEMYIRFAQERMTIQEIPINLSNRQSGESYKGLMRYGWGVVRAILVSLTDRNNHKLCV